MDWLNNPLVQKLIITIVGAFIVRELNKFLPSRQRTYNRGYIYGSKLRSDYGKISNKIGGGLVDRIFGAIKNTARDFLSGVIDGFNKAPKKILQNKGYIIKSKNKK